MNFNTGDIVRIKKLCEMMKEDDIRTIEYEQKHTYFLDIDNPNSFVETDDYIKHKITMFDKYFEVLKELNNNNYKTYIDKDTINFIEHMEKKLD